MKNFEKILKKNIYIISTKFDFQTNNETTNNNIKIYKKEY